MSNLSLSLSIHNMAILAKRMSQRLVAGLDADAHAAMNKK